MIRQEAAWSTPLTSGNGSAISHIVSGWFVGDDSPHSGSVAGCQGGADCPGGPLDHDEREAACFTRTSGRPRQSGPGSGGAPLPSISLDSHGSGWAGMIPHSSAPGSVIVQLFAQWPAEILLELALQTISHSGHSRRSGGSAEERALSQQVAESLTALLKHHARPSRFAWRCARA